MIVCAAEHAPQCSDNAYLCSALEYATSLSSRQSASPCTACWPGLRFKGKLRKLRSSQVCTSQPSSMLVVCDPLSTPTVLRLERDRCQDPSVVSRLPSVLPPSSSADRVGSIMTCRSTLPHATVQPRRPRHMLLPDPTPGQRAQRVRFPSFEAGRAALRRWRAACKMAR